MLTSQHGFEDWEGLNPILTPILDLALAVVLTSGLDAVPDPVLDKNLIPGPGPGGSSGPGPDPGISPGSGLRPTLDTVLASVCCPQ